MRQLSVFPQLQANQNRFIQTSICFETDHAGVLLTLPYFACHAKKYNKAPSGWPTRQKLTQNTELPMILPVGSSIFSNGSVTVIRGS